MKGVGIMFKKVAYVLACSMLFASAVSAASSVSGTSSGGTLGSTNISGSVSVTNGAVGFYVDYAESTTNSIALGTVGAGVVLHYATNSNGDNTVSDYDIQYDALSARAFQSANYTGTYATGGHTYSSSQYGSWSGSTSQYF